MRVLVLAGTSEARNLAQAIDALPNVEVIASLAGETRRPADLGVETRIGGFGGEVGFASYLTDTAITHVIDATHPFAANITRTAAAVCGARKLPFTILQRPAWEPNTDDKWHMIDQARDCADLIARGKTVFLATGRKTLQEFDNMQGRKLLARVIDPPQNPFPFEGGDFVIGRPPFSIEDEIALFQLLGVDWLVVKNSGGTASKSKLDAAARLGLPVAMIKRPAAPNLPILKSVDDCLIWIKQYA